VSPCAALVVCVAMRRFCRIAFPEQLLRISLALGDGFT
jgi:hypothetical protein